MVPSLKTLRDGSPLEIREATAEDAVPLQSYIEATSAESNFLSFGPGEFGISIEENQVFLEQCQKTDNLLYLVASSRDLIVGSLVFHGGKRPRMRHCGEFGISVSKSHWGLGVGGFLVDAMITWAK
ncbi:MAG: GNAT family N-acetyltransferase, partial [Candidatus Eisenbacteria bacterium]|nr:GNAT family N-acetyltransferase [Candidatus Eisenbacteria bacterium]